MIIPTKANSPLVALVLVIIPGYGLQSCAGLPRDEAGHVNMVALADEIDLYRQDIDGAASLAEPEVAARVADISQAVSSVVQALRATGSGGSITDVKSAASIMLSTARSVLDELEGAGKDVRNVRAVVVVLESFMRHARFGDMERAEKALETNKQEQ